MDYQTRAWLYGRLWIVFVVLAVGFSGVKSTEESEMGAWVIRALVAAFAAAAAYALVYSATNYILAELKEKKTAP